MVGKWFFWFSKISLFYKPVALPCPTECVGQKLKYPVTTERVWYLSGRVGKWVIFGESYPQTSPQHYKIKYNKTMTTLQELRQQGLKREEYIPERSGFQKFWVDKEGSFMMTVDGTKVSIGKEIDVIIIGHGYSFVGWDAGKSVVCRTTVFTDPEKQVHHKYDRQRTGNRKRFHCCLP